MLQKYSPWPGVQSMSGPAAADAITMPVIAAAVMITVVSEVNFMIGDRWCFLSQGCWLCFYT
jgi:hypothetical protein